jgi:hypothetical protein
MNSSLPQFEKQDVVTATPARLGATKPGRLMRVIMYCAAAGICEFKNGATDTGDVLLTIAGSAANTITEVDLTTVGGIAFSTAIFVKPTGAGNIVHCWYG